MQFHKELAQFFLTFIVERIKMKRSKVVFGMAFLLCLTMTTWGAAPQLINYQGLLKNNLDNPVPDSNYSVVFTIYDDSTGGTNLWSETDTVTTASGLFTVLLGSGPTPLVDSIFDDTTRYLGIKVGADPEMSPRDRLVTVPYSYRTSTVDGASGGTITGSVGMGTSPSSDVKLIAISSGSEGFPLSGLIGRAINSSFGDARGIVGVSSSSGGTSYGVYGEAFTYGVYALGDVYGVGATGGLYGGTFTGTGVSSGGVRAVGESFGVHGNSTSGIGVSGAGGTNGVSGVSTSGTGVYASSSNGPGVQAFGGTNAVEATGTSRGVYATGGNYGIVGDGGINGLYGFSSAGTGVSGEGGNIGVYGYSSAGSGTGVYADGIMFGVYGASDNIGVLGYCNVTGGAAVLGNIGLNLGTWGGYFQGDVKVERNIVVVGSVFKGGGGFKIDHPTDPANKYLYHSFVESPDMKNIYDGVVTIDATGEALVTLPDWFGAVNRDFRYQLTSIGAPGPNLHIANEISGNQFKIAGGTAGMKVSWQVTGIRRDAYADAHRIPLEEAKKGKELGKYLHPTEHGVSEALGIQYEMTQKLIAERKQQEEQQAKMEAERKLQEEQRVKMEAEHKLLEEQKAKIEQERK